MKCKKPSQSIYEVLLQHIHQHLSPSVRPSQVIFIDDKDENIEAARKFGLQGFVWNRDINTVEELLQGLSTYGVDLQ